MQIFIAGSSSASDGDIRVEVSMKKHRWIRRLFLLVILVLLGVIILQPHEKAGNTASDAAGASEDVDSIGEMLTATVRNEDGKGEETIVGFMIEKISAGEVELTDEGSIRQALADAERELSISLSEEDKDKVTGFLQTLGNVEVGTEDFIDQAKEKYREYSVGFVEEANEAINEAVESAVTNAARNFFDSIQETVSDFFKNLIP